MTDAPPSEGYAASGDLQIYYECRGEGPPMVLVHGWGSSLESNWIRTGWADALTSIRRVVMLDVRGHGNSTKPHQQSLYSYRAMARDVLAVMDHLDIDRVDFLGYSMGSFMGAALLKDSSRRFRSMILGGIGDENADSLAVLDDIATGLRTEDPDELSNPVSRGYRDYADADPRNDREALALSALQMWPEGFPLELIGPDTHGIETNVLIVNGGDDHPYVDTAQKMVDVLPDARMTVIPGHDHMTVIPDPRFIDEVLAFLRTLP